MSSKHWEGLSVSLSQLHKLAEGTPWSEQEGVFAFLRYVGVVPEDVATMPARRVKLSIGRDNVTAGYLASAAFEWDREGRSRPIDFIEAIEAEIGPRRDYIGSVLTTLGREA